MAYDKKNWKRRIAERSDMSTNLVHLTREAGKSNALDVLYKILKEKKLKGSSTTSGFICGDRKAVCFQDAPLSSICQNVFFEQKQRELNEKYKIRYRAIGLAFSKPYIYSKGGRPVVYDKTTEAKAYLPADQLWRIVNLNLESENNIIDWTHEREWRVPDCLEFTLSEVTIVAINNDHIKTLAEKFQKLDGFDIRNEVAGIVTLESILY